MNSSSSHHNNITTLGRFLALVLIGLLSFSCATNSDNKRTAHNHFRLGVSYLDKRDYNRGLKELLIARDLDPANHLILNHLGLAYFFLEEYEHAVVSLEEALSHEPNYSEAHNNIGRVYIDMKSFRKAREHLFKAAQDLTYPHKDKVWLNIGLSHFYEGRHKQAQKYFLKAISANRKNCLAYNYYGRSFIETEKYKNASKSLDQAIYHCQGNDYDEPHYYSAVALFRMGQKTSAIARLQEAQKLYPKGPYKKRIREMLGLMKITDAK